MKKALVIGLLLATAACAQDDAAAPAEDVSAEAGSEALTVVQGFYEAIGAGDMETVASLLAEDVQWSEAEGSPLAAGNPYVGFEAMGAGVFGPINEAYADFAGVPQTFTAQDDRVLVEGRYSGTHRESGETLDAPFVHAFTVADGQIVAFQQYTDTYQWRRQAGALEE